MHKTHPSVLPILFNHIFRTGIYPKEWSMAYLNPLFKKGDRLGPENYRGIAIGPCMAKAFNEVLNNRMEEIMLHKRFSNDLQIGFEKKTRVTDHLLVLRTVLDQAKMSKRDRFVVFIDFKQAYNRVQPKFTHK